MIVNQQIKFGPKNYSAYISIIDSDPFSVITELLIDNIDLQKGDWMGNSIIKYICTYASSRTIEYLLEKYIKKNRKNIYRDAPFMLLSRNNKLSKEFVDRMVIKFQ